MKTIQLKIEGMSCGHCKKHVEDVFKAKEGVAEVTLILEKGTASILFDENIIDEASLKASLDGSPYTVVS